MPRLRALFRNWMNRTSVEIDSGCIYISGAVEFDDRPGPVRDALVGSVKSWLAAMNRAVVQAKEEGHLRADIDEQQLAFEIHGLILALHYEARFLKNPGSIARAHVGLRQHPQAVRNTATAGSAAAQTHPNRQIHQDLKELPCPPTPRPCATCNS